MPNFLFKKFTINTNFPPYSTILDTGNSYHIYLPVGAFVLESENVFSEFIEPLKKVHPMDRDQDKFEEIFDYSYFKIEQIIEELDITKEEMCKIYWNRITNMIYKIGESGITENKLWLCINYLNVHKCKVKKEWRKWLITKDKNYDIKNAIMKDLAHTSIL